MVQYGSVKSQNPHHFVTGKHYQHINPGVFSHLTISPIQHNVVLGHVVCLFNFHWVYQVPCLSLKLGLGGDERPISHAHQPGNLPPSFGLKEQLLKLLGGCLVTSMEHPCCFFLATRCWQQKFLTTIHGPGRCEPSFPVTLEVGKLGWRWSG